MNASSSPDKPLQDYINHLSILLDLSPIESNGAVILPSPASLAERVYADIELTHSDDAYYSFYTDGSLIHLGTPKVSMGWSWVQIHASHLTIATYAHETIAHWPSSSCAEAAAVYAALSFIPNGVKVSLYTSLKSKLMQAILE
ncbi:hypothetical protein C1646_765665 [Rhizophagus diaphanus]|nr:hypothetical protein C1646_765665 [Rhizophagus diaphanus] [Rhizophagus sp. MUCL 43196]